MRYGTRAVCYVAQHRDSADPITIQKIADEEDIPIRYLEQIMVRLRRAGVLKSIRGPGGGYRLPRDPSQILLCEVIEAAEGDLNVVWCVDASSKPRCDRQEGCSSRHIWQQMNEWFKEILSGISIQDVLDKRWDGTDLEIWLKRKKA